MKHIKFRIPTSISDIKQLIREKQDRRYNHNKQVVRNMYKEIVTYLKEHCVRYVDGGKAKLDDCNHTWIDDCGEDRIGYIETEK